ncbi:MAG TPA: hypothetical protein VE046_02800 [Steroidobacteraceae bacterium]|nr:hypothetical protein [Steroidobacteraceae bacterium]
MRFLHRGVPLAAAAFALAGLAPPADACSICRCGDPTFNALGKDVVAAAGWRFALDWERFSKTQGASDQQDSVVERRYTGVLAYTFADRLLLVARIPYSKHSLDETAGDAVERTETSGLADPELYAQVRLWSSPFAGDLGRRASISATFGVKTDWGVNDASRDGERLDEHAQPGTGSTDAFFGFSGYYLIDRKSSFFASVQARLPGSNDFGYRYGRIYLANLAYERKLATKLDSVLELNYRHAGRDEIDATGVLDGDTGGSMVYLTPRLLVEVGGGVVLRGAVQIPLVENLNGVQDEKAVYNLGVTYSF